MWLEYCVIAAIVVGLAVLARCCLVHVRAGESVVIERGGKFHRCLAGGWHVLVPCRDRRRGMYWRVAETGLDGMEPIVDRLNWRIDLRPAHYELAGVQVATADQVPLTLTAVWSVAVAKPEVAVYADSHLPRAVCEIAAARVQQEIAKLTAEAILKDIAGAASQVQAVLAEALGALGLRLCEVQFSSALPADEIREAIEKRIAATLDKETALTAAEAAAQAVLEEGKTRQQLAIMEAETQRRVAELTADAEAEALRKIGSAIENPDVARHALAIRYLEVLRQMAAATNAKTVFIPYDAGVTTGALDLIRQSLEAKPEG